jgi:outer membrane receptor for ferrienterochelin and colicins
MNTLQKNVLLFTMLFSIILFAQKNTKEEVFVNGNCNMCKTRIENAAKKAGAKTAIWSSETKKLLLEFDPAKSSTAKILQNVADAGHDNQLYKTSAETYDNLPGCCLYDRETPIPAKDLEQKDLSYSVKGHCGMCKSRIESTAKKAGATSATWDLEAQRLTMEFDENKTSAKEILQKIADVGHDNEMFRAKDETYEALPDCCLYDRKSEFPAIGEKVIIENGHVKSISSEKDEHDENEHDHNKEQNIKGVKIVKTPNATAINKNDAGLTFNISGKELLKAACCNLSESFETNATVDVAYSNAVTGTKQLRMLGLDQKYTALTKESLPEIRGLATAYGLNFIPGRWIGGIQLTKGGSTVVNGYESITGQINTELLKFNEVPETNLNIFGDLNGRGEVNLTQTSAINEKWNQSILLHGNATTAKMDYNDDGFLDQPTGNQLNAAYLLNYNDLENSGFGSHFGINFLKDERNAGQTAFNNKLDQSEQAAYGVGIDISRFQVWNKTGYIFKGKPYQSIGFMNQYTYHQQDSFFGLKDYNGTQNTYYSNLIFESILGNTNHKYKAGVSFLYDSFNENYINQNFKREETAPGIFAEYTQTGTKYTLVAGARVDFHNLAGPQFSPRLNFKYDVAPKTILRLSAGRGFRTANIFAESQSYMASNRNLEIINNNGNIYGLEPEIAWNYGVSLHQEFKIFNRKSSIVADFFRTDFQNQVLADLDISPQKLVFYNLKGNSFANSFQTQWDFTPFKNFDVRLAYKYYQVEADYTTGKRDVPFISKNRGFANFSYATDKNEKQGNWTFDTTLNLVGKQRLPDTKTNPAQFQLPEYSPSYFTMNAQIAKNLNDKIRIYLGAENLTSYTQENPILDVKNPFSNYFDGGMVYAPIMPINAYVGFDVKF